MRYQYRHYVINIDAIARWRVYAPRNEYSSYSLKAIKEGKSNKKENAFADAIKCVDALIVQNRAKNTANWLNSIDHNPH